ncbi:hypothetical protein DSM104299_03055 [Baekduia alba]|uniref:hypothetical protein n=1 Tax=Baekduia alba TaxID=2997333 RepID=UPI0023424159|nr:hypothetical protein [Baekduia alba]WCB94323.1 hypothetical protein DSM104299_03055 [Baekduia alba]
MAEPSSKAFHEFLTGLSKEPSARNSFLEDPVGAMDRAGLSDTQKLALLSQDERRIQTELGGTDAAIRIRVIVTILVDF